MASVIGGDVATEFCSTSSVAPRSAATDRVKILHLINGDVYAGAERVQDLMALGMGACGYELGFACLKPGRFVTDRRSQQTPLVDVPMRSKLDLSPARRIVKMIRTGDYRLLHTHSPRTAIIGCLASAWAGVPMVHHLHSPAGAEYKQSWRNQLNTLVERLSLMRTARIIAVSHSVAEHGRQDGLAADRITVVHNGVPIQNPLPERAAPTAPWTLGVAALFRPRKGLEVLIDSLAILRAEGHDVRLRAVGAFFEPDYESQIKAQVARLHLEDAIDWVGFTRNVIGEMRKMDLFVLPSLFGEGLPMVVLEAMSTGLPVIGTRVEGVPEALRDGVDGFIATPGDPDDLARAIERVIRGDVDWSLLSRNAQEHQANHFSDRAMVASMARVYSELLER